jgi:hypothetical protein
MYYDSEEQLERARRDPARAFEDKIFWCLKTFAATGPDQEGLGAEECGPGRGCYEA